MAPFLDLKHFNKKMIRCFTYIYGGGNEKQGKIKHLSDDCVLAMHETAIH